MEHTVRAKDRPSRRSRARPDARPRSGGIRTGAPTAWGAAGAPGSADGGRGHGRRGGGQKTLTP